MKTKGIVLMIIVVGSLGFSGYLIYDRSQFLNHIESLEATLEAQENEISDLQSQISNMTGRIERLGGEVTVLEYEKRSLEEELGQLEEELRVKEASLKSLQRSHDRLQDNYNSLKTAYSLESELRIGNSLESYYDSLREDLGPTGSRFWWTDPEKHFWEIKIEFAAALAQHDLYRTYWPSLETDYEELTGESSCETAWNKLSAIVSYTEVSRNDSPEAVISKILGFLKENIHYEVEVNDVFLAPVETLGYKSGDCDDYSILAAALLEYSGIDAAIGFFVNDRDEYHAMVLVHLEDLEDYSYWYYEDLKKIGLSEGRWITIEPQTNLDNQGGDWIVKWDLLVAEELDG